MSDRLKLLPRIEITPPKTSKGFDTLNANLATLPSGFQIEIVFSPRDPDPISDILKATAAIERAGHQPVPHISARGLEKGQLRPFLEALSEQRVTEVLVVGGDPNPPKGPYHESLQVLEEIAEHNKQTPEGITKVGIAGHPDGHPQATIKDIQTKVNFLRTHGLEPHIQTQPVSNAERLVNYGIELKQAGVDAPVKVGLFGPGTAIDYLEIASKVGVKKSLVFLWRNPEVLAAAILESVHALSYRTLQTKIDTIKSRFNYGPESLIADIASHPRLDETSIEGVYLFSLKNFGKSTRFYLEQLAS